MSRWKLQGSALVAPWNNEHHRNELHVRQCCGGPHVEFVAWADLDGEQHDVGALVGFAELQQFFAANGYKLEKVT